MKRLLLIVAALAVAVSPATAGQIQVGYNGSAYGLYQTGQGGEFTFNDVNPDGWLDLAGYSTVTKNFGPAGISSFQTFCVEVNEHINGYASTYNAALNTNAIYGGVGSGGDPLSAGTGYLYSQFATGNLTSYNYSGSRQTTADLLQKTIWWLEDEGADPGTSNVFRREVLAFFGDTTPFITADDAPFIALAKANGASAFGVYAVNLWTGNDPNSNRAQDGLFYSCDTCSNPVPDPMGSLAALGLGVLSLASLRRRLRK